MTYDNLLPRTAGGFAWSVAPTDQHLTGPAGEPGPAGGAGAGAGAGTRTAPPAGGGAPLAEQRQIPTMDDLRGQTPDQLRDLVDLCSAHIRSLHQDDSGAIRSMDEAETEAFDQLLTIRQGALDRLEEHRRVELVLQRQPEQVRTALDHLANRDDPFRDVRRLSSREVRDQAMRRLDSKYDTAHMSDVQKTEVERQVRLSPDIARRILVTETDAYREAFMKMVTKPNAALYLTEEERTALRAFDEFRAMSENTTTAGGFGIPVFIDPSITLTAQESGNPFLEIARQENINTNQWKGVTSAGVTWAFQTEAAPAGDASPSLAQPTVQVHMARGFIPYSIEVDQDYPGFADEMQRLLSEGYDELLTNKFTVGTGVGEPRGILTALSANTNVRVRVQTSGTNFGAGDPYNVWKALPKKYRQRASWLMSVGVNNAFRQLGTANVYHAASINIPEEWLETLFNKPVYEGVYLPDVTTNTAGTDGLAIVGDFRNFLIARRGGMSIELLQNLVQQVTAGTGPAVPTGQRGWFAYARIGSNSINDLGFRLLTNT